MVQARRQEAWGHTSSLLAMLVNTQAFRDPGATPAHPRDFNPTAKPQSLVRGRVGDLRDLFVREPAPAPAKATPDPS